MSLSNLLLPDASSDKTIYCHNVIADYDSSFTNIDLSGVATCSTAPTLGTHLCNKTYVDSASSGGDVVGPASSTDNAVARYDTTTGKLLQNSGVIIDDSNNITGVANITSTGANINGNCQVRNYSIFGDASYDGKLVNMGTDRPTITNGTMQVWSRDTAGQATVNASATSVITFKTPFPVGDNVIVQLTSRTAGSNFYLSSTSVNGFTVVNSIASLATYCYFVISCRA